jgi:hypothetical protein
MSSPYGVKDDVVVIPDLRAETPPAADANLPATLPDASPVTPKGCDVGTGCAASCFSRNGIGSACDQERVWVNAEYLLWWLKSNPTPPLIGTLPAALAVQNLNDLPAGAIGNLFGGSPLRFDAFSGGRISAGGWLNPEQTVGLEAGAFYLERRNISFGAATKGDPVVGPVFFDITANKESIIVPVSPADAVENARAFASERFWGAEANYRYRACTFSNSPLDVLVGFRYLNLDNDLGTQSTINFLDFGSRTFADLFHTRDQFYGVQVGAALDLREGPWSVYVLGKIALGSIHQSVDINGSTTTIPFGQAPQQIQGGVLAQSTNIGHFTHNEFSWVPEFTINFGYQVTQHLRVYVGYTFLALDHTVQPGNVIDAVNPSKIQSLIVSNPVNLARPAPLFRETDFWAQGLNFGMEFQY